MSYIKNKNIILGHWKMESELWTARYEELRTGLDEFCIGKISSAELKKASAPLGIYEQRNGKFMVRVRVTGGEISLEKLQILADISKKSKVGHIHLSTRQCIQLHDVPAENIYSIVSSCNESGIPFRGGGGDTFRNIYACHHSGVSQNSIFDVTPYAKALKDFMFSYEKAFTLPRKLKIGFVCCEEESRKAEFQDLGFVAKIKNGIEGFAVFGGGGMGRESAGGVRLFDFIPLENIFRCAKAATDLFHDHGDRSNRTKARLRFFAINVGPDAFRKIFMDYYDKTDAPSCPKTGTNYISLAGKLKRDFPPNLRNVKTEDFGKWVAYAASPTFLSLEINSVDIPVPFGNLGMDELISIINILQKTGSNFLRITQNQNIFLPLVHSNALPYLFELLSMTDEKFVSTAGEELPVACVGAKTCKIGMLDSPSISLEISRRLKEISIRHSGNNSAAISEMIRSIKISGCPNACGGHILAPLGIQGFLKNIEGKTADFVRILVADPKSAENGGLPLEKAVLSLPEAFRMIEIIAENYLISGSASFADFIRSCDIVSLPIKEH